MYQQSNYSRNQQCNVEQHINPYPIPKKKPKKYEPSQPEIMETKLNTSINDNFTDLLEHNKCKLICKILNHCGVNSQLSRDVKSRLKKQINDVQR